MWGLGYHAIKVTSTWWTSAKDQMSSHYEHTRWTNHIIDMDKLNKLSNSHYANARWQKTQYEHVALTFVMNTSHYVKRVRLMDINTSHYLHYASKSRHSRTHHTASNCDMNNTHTMTWANHIIKMHVERITPSTLTKHNKHKQLILWTCVLARSQLGQVLKGCMKNGHEQITWLKRSTKQVTSQDDTSHSNSI